MPAQKIYPLETRSSMCYIIDERYSGKKLYHKIKFSQIEQGQVRCFVLPIQFTRSVINSHFLKFHSGCITGGKENEKDSSNKPAGTGAG